MTRSCALADLAPYHVECNTGGGWQPDGEEKVKRILTGLKGISALDTSATLNC
jgi:hypothetical protein